MVEPWVGDLDLLSGLFRHAQYSVLVHQRSGLVQRSGLCHAPSLPSLVHGVLGQQPVVAVLQLEELGQGLVFLKIVD